MDAGMYARVGVKMRVVARREDGNGLGKKKKIHSPLPQEGRREEIEAVCRVRTTRAFKCATVASTHTLPHPHPTTEDNTLQFRVTQKKSGCNSCKIARTTVTQI